MEKGEGGFKTYKIKVHKGVLGDYGHEWWTCEEWEKWNKFVEECKADGTYGEESEIELQLRKHPIFDDLTTDQYNGLSLDMDNIERRTRQPLELHRLIFVDMSKNQKINPKK